MLNKTAKSKVAKIDTIPTVIGIVCCVGTAWFEFVKIKCARISLHVKSPTFRTTKLKGFTVSGTVFTGQMR